MKKGNNNIALFKFIFSWVIVFFHFFPAESGRFIGGYIGVDYYILVAGVFFFLSYEKQAAVKLSTPYEWLEKRFRRFFPWAITAFVFSVLVERDFPISAVQALDHFSSDIWEILLVKWNGMNNNVLLINGPAWTLSSMLLAGFLIWGALYYFPEKFLNYFMPISLIAGFGIWSHVESAGTEVWIGFTTFGTFRTYLVMCLGYYCLKLSHKLEETDFNICGKTVLTLLEIVCQVLSIEIMLNRETRYYQWFAILLMIVATAIALSKHSLLTALLSKIKCVYFLQDISLSIYLMHYGSILLFSKLFGTAYSGRYIASLTIFIIAASLAHHYITKAGIKLSKRGYEKLKCRLTEGS